METRDGEVREEILKFSRWVASVEVVKLDNGTYIAIGRERDRQTVKAKS